MYIYCPVINFEEYSLALFTNEKSTAKLQYAKSGCHQVPGQCQPEVFLPCYL